MTRSSARSAAPIAGGAVSATGIEAGQLADSAARNAESRAALSRAVHPACARDLEDVVLHLEDPRDADHRGREALSHLLRDGCRGRVAIRGGVQDEGRELGRHAQSVA